MTKGLRRAEATGRPLGAPEFVTGLENLPGRKIARRVQVENQQPKPAEQDRLYCCE
ncbi:MAG: hypothetical protein ABSF17_00060 [Terracidiphilus sp.]